MAIKKCLLVLQNCFFLTNVLYYMFYIPPKKGGCSDMKIAMISARPKIADKKSNIKTMEKYIRNTPADLYVFGELFLSGYKCKDELRNLAETIQGPSIQHMKKIAKDRKCYIVFGMPLKNSRVEGLIHNAAILIHPDGKVDSYKKWFLPTFGPFEEKIFFDEGEELRVFTTRFGKIGLIICYDLYFPEIPKALSLQGADILICISASPSTTRTYFEKLLPARALENTAFMVYVNLVGTEEDLVMWGGSQIYDPMGNLLVKAPYFEESIITQEIDLKQIKITRANRPVIRDIRPEIYQDLYKLSRFHTKKEENKK
ncbi:MAG: carbon-nitrogen hydrolase family protein [Thermoplasmata archaeon]|nr:MAG: carbon-nitrogen hydrolase family protein [Thermoplasmata archaeon]RLF36815.1 MAG: carbon-nitrogen hydrolase family protein [Thermoplasmata archaeon]